MPSRLRRTLESGDAWFYSRSRAELWRKGETSGSYMRVRSVSVDCDGDTLLLKVDPEGSACHTGERTCFFTPLEATPQFERADTGPGIVEELFAVIQDRKRDMPEGSYTADLLRRGVDRVSQKVIEEAGRRRWRARGATGRTSLPRPPTSSTTPSCFWRPRTPGRRTSGSSSESAGGRP